MISFLSLSRWRLCVNSTMSPAFVTCDLFWPSGCCSDSKVSSASTSRTFIKKGARLPPARFSRNGLPALRGSPSPSSFSCFRIYFGVLSLAHPFKWFSPPLILTFTICDVSNEHVIPSHWHKKDFPQLKFESRRRWPHSAFCGGRTPLSVVAVGRCL
jgi:hypothetical protein